jgi:hypothetical protein
MHIISVFKVTRSKDVDLAKKHTSRTVFRCNVIGPPGSGKVSVVGELLLYSEVAGASVLILLFQTAFLQGHVNRSLEVRFHLSLNHIFAMK